MYNYYIYTLCGYIYYKFCLSMHTQILFCLITLVSVPKPDAIPEKRWGFYAHKKINRLAVYTLPPEMFGFYKYHIQYITEHAVDPDARRYVVEGEAPRHYIDIDVYGDSAIYHMPRRWYNAVEKYSEDTLQAYGIVPWHIQTVKYRLTKAFEEKNAKLILKLSAELGHYIADANVPLHTTENYNGQLSGQYGIHGFWETRLPEKFSDSYDLFTGPANYIEHPLLTAWDAATHAHLALDSVFTFEKILTSKLGDDKKFSFETRAGKTIKTYSDDFSTAYHKALEGQVEQRMRASIKMVGDFWFTCWVDAGQPNLDSLLDKGFSEAELQKLKEEQKNMLQDRKVKSRPHSNN